MKILCATDLNPNSELAIHRAAELAQSLDAQLSLLHVVVPSVCNRKLEQDVLKATEFLKARSAPLGQYEYAPNILVRVGNPARILAQTTDDIGADLIVLGAQRKRTAADAIVGTLAQQVLSERRRSVLIVRRGVCGAYSNVLLALGMSESDAAIVRAAETFAVRGGVRASVVHAYRPPIDGILTSVGVAGEANAVYSQMSARQARIAIRRLLIGASESFNRYKIILDAGDVVTSIQKVAEREDPDLLIVGTRGHGRLRRALFGSVASRVTAVVNSDVLVIPEGHTSASALFSLRSRAYPDGSRAPERFARVLGHRRDGRVLDLALD